MATEFTTPVTQTAPPPQRLLSLDTYRGLIMVSLAFGGFGLLGLSQNLLKEYPSCGVLPVIAYHFEHVEWLGCAFWDLIQPSFMFMVGVSMAFSYASRRDRGQSWLKMFFHAVWRSFALIALAILLRSTGSPTTNWTFMDVLSQIGLGYTFLFLLWNRSPLVQAVAAVGILVATWLMYTQYPTAGVDLERGAPEVGVTKKWAQEHLTGVDPHWHKNANVGHAIDLVVLNQFPRPKPFDFNSGGYQTVNFLPSLATMLFGLMAGEWLRSSRSPGMKVGVLFLAGLAGLGIGEAMQYFGVVPIVKRIWTPSWALFSTGWCLLILGGLYGLVDVLRWRFWTWPFIVVGTNSIAIYCMAAWLKPFINRMIHTHFGPNPYTSPKPFGWDWSYFSNMWEPWIIDPAYEPLIRNVTLGMALWFVCLWLYRRKIFIRI